MLHSVISSEFNLFNGYVILLKCTHFVHDLFSQLTHASQLPTLTNKLVYTLVLDHKLMSWGQFNLVMALKTVANFNWYLKKIFVLVSLLNGILTVNVSL